MKIRNVVRWIGMIDYLEYQDAMEKIERMLESPDTLPVTLFITSEGGFVPIAYSFCQEVRMRSIPLNTVIVGRADSAAIPIALMGKIRAIERESHIFLHPLQFSEDEEYEKKENMTNWYLRTIQKNTKLKYCQIRKMMEDETLLNAEQAKSYGFVQEVL